MSLGRFEWIEGGQGEPCTIVDRPRQPVGVLDVISIGTLIAPVMEYADLIGNAGATRDRSRQTCRLPCNDVAFHRDTGWARRVTVG